MKDVKGSPKEIINSASPKTRKMVNDILEIEREYQHYKNTGAAGSVEKTIAQRIMKLIERGIEK